jgi:hypothetical protein
MTEQDRKEIEYRKTIANWMLHNRPNDSGWIDVGGLRHAFAEFDMPFDGSGYKSNPAANGFVGPDRIRVDHFTIRFVFDVDGADGLEVVAQMFDAEGRDLGFVGYDRYYNYGNRKVKNTLLESQINEVIE